MTQIIYVDRSRYQTAQRCRRMRWLEYHEGAEQVGLVPKRKSLHLVVGSAVHAGMEQLLSLGQQGLDNIAARHPELSLADQLIALFDYRYADRQTAARQIEDRAVEAALADLQKEFGSGVELDPEEAAAGQAAKQPDGLTASPQIDMGGLRPGQSSNTVEQDSPIVIEFETTPSGGLTMNPMLNGEPLPPGTYSAVMVPKLQQSSEECLREELAALVEGMVRAWSRRKFRALLEQFEVLEVEREGEWELAYWQGEHDLGCHSSACDIDHSRSIHFLSRHDALLLERSTNYLYLQSFKTTGSWDRRKEMDAQVDMQGLSEAVDVEKRFGEAHELLIAMAKIEKWAYLMVSEGRGMCTDCGAMESADQHEYCKDCKCGSTFEKVDANKFLAADAEYLDESQRVRELVSDRVADWLRSLPDPPQILGVRYEYLLKGMRKKDRKDAMNPDRYVQESILCRAYKQEGITSDDRRWAWTYDWQDESGKGRRLDYRSWAKHPVWKFMSIADWIDLLDQGKVQEGALNEQGEPLDALGEQFVPVVTVYRAADEMRDLLEQLSSQEEQIAKDVEEVRQAEREGGAGAKRSALNRLFGQNRQACSYPGICAYRTTATQAGFCFGGSDPFSDSSVLERFRERVPNHPQESSGIVKISLDKQEIAE